MFRNIVSKNLCMDDYTKKKGAKIYKGRRLNEILGQNHDQRLFNNFRMLRDTFFKLRDFCLEHTTKLKSSRGVTVEEKLAIFMFVVTKGISFANAQELFDRSKANIANCFHQTLYNILTLHIHEIKLPENPDYPPSHNRIINNKKYFP